MRYFSIISTFATGLACGVFGVMFAQYQTSVIKVEPQAESISVLEDEIMSIIFRTDKMTFVAQRSMPGGEFAVQTTYADGRDIQQCRVSSDLAGQLSNYSTITTQHQLQSIQHAEKDFPIKLGILELRDRMENAPAIVIQLRTNSDRKFLAALYDDVAVEVTNPEIAFSNLEKGCDFLMQ
jgi:hypothetical protein